MRSTSRGILSWAVVSLAVSGCAGTGPGTSMGDPAQARDVPALKVVTDCGPCQVRPTVPGLIAQGYASAAAESNAKVLPDRIATVSIKEYTARDDGARVLAGAFAGKDEIKAEVSFEGRQFMVEDYYRNAWLGIEALAKKIGAMVFEQMK